MTLDYEKEVTGIAELAPFPESVRPEAILIASRTLELIDVKYGLTSDQPLPYHNAPHSLTVCRRTMRLTNLLYPYIPPPLRVNICDLAIMGGPLHDVEQGHDPHRNVVESAEHGTAMIEDQGGVHLNNPQFKHRLHEMIIGTEAQIDKSGRVFQPNIRSGSHDPAKFKLAFSDICGIAMEGPRRMINDATNLCYEIFGTPTFEQYFTFLKSQVSFMRHQLNDHVIMANIAYHFPANQPNVYAALHGAFHENIIAAHGLATVLNERPEMEGILAKIVRKVDLPGDANIVAKALSTKLKNQG